MKKSVLAALVLGATLAISACDNKDSKPAPTAENAKTSVTEAKDAVVNAAKDVKDAAVEKTAEVKDAAMEKATEVKDATVKKAEKTKKSFFSWFHKKEA